ncbi:acyltransferase family protein [Mycolicibacterium sp. J2]|uniref:acyltransferase family protein n=1 Tax=Mycolicibacterium sp. J2 TaxID=2993511 RepID=UPI00224B8DAF|nr:acyltransferase family protein [Mycolicibacterium sp. J2]MCX2712481.1 acyltransferase family protein [Mycolicibacterium sp. J2]
MSGRSKRLDIQGMRAIAVALVLLFHAEIPGFGGGYVGVDVFFVISGFLISTHLLEHLQRSGHIGYSAFYARRARRLLPAAFLVIMATLVAATVLVSPVQFRYVVKDAMAAALYVPNLLFAYNATDYLAEKTPSLFLHYWSLGIEEQFYLVWPVLLALVFGRFALRWRFRLTLAALTAASFVLCVWLTGFSQANAFFMLPARMWEFGLGALVAVGVLRRGRILPTSIAPLAGWLGLGAVIAGGVLFSTATEYPGYAVALPVVGAALLIAAGPVARGPAAVLSVRPLTWLGDISYSLYLVHWPVLMLPVAATGYMQPLPLWLRAVAATACIPLAWLLYRYVEQPGQRAAWLTGARPRRTFAVAAAGMAAIVVAGATAVVTLHPPLSAGKPVAHTSLSIKPAGTPYVPDNLNPALDTAESDQPVVYTNGCHRSLWSTDAAGCMTGTNPAAPLVALFGDSHATQWYPALSALAERGVIRLDSHTKSACPAVPVPIAHYAACAAWRSAVIDKLADSKPDLILLAGYPRNYLGRVDAPARAWRSASAALLDQLPPTARVGIFADTPSTGVTPSICLGRFVDDARRCALPRDAALDEDIRATERQLAAARSVSYLDYADYLCNDAMCPAIIGNTLVYRDGSHLTAQMSAELAPLVGVDTTALLPRRESPADGAAGPQMVIRQPGG